MGEFDAAMRRIQEQAEISPSVDRCPHGNEICPCQDAGDPCLHEGPTVAAVDPATRRSSIALFGPEPCPNPPDVLTDRTGILNSTNSTFPHCHVEGCSWLRPMSDPKTQFCGLMDRLHMDPPDLDVPGLDALRGTPWWACGEARRAASTP